MYLGLWMTLRPSSYFKGPKSINTFCIIVVVRWLDSDDEPLEVVLSEMAFWSKQCLRPNTILTCGAVCSLAILSAKGVTRQQMPILLSRLKHTNPFVMRSAGLNAADCDFVLSWRSIEIGCSSLSPNETHAVALNSDRLLINTLFSSLSNDTNATFKSISHLLVTLRIISFGLE